MSAVKFVHTSKPISARRPLLGRLIARLSRARELRKQRQALLRLDAHMLADVGLTPAQAQAEAEIPLWDVPQHWQRQSGW